MNIKKMILGKIEKNGSARASEIVKLTGFSRAYINRFFQELRSEGKIVLFGNANRAVYLPADRAAVSRAKDKITQVHRLLRNENLSEDTVLADIKKKTGIFRSIPDNVSKIADYAFSEILNNAIEHSQSGAVEITMKKEASAVNFNVRDRGIGIFRNIMKKRKLHGTMEAIQDLIKGKQTTAPATHSGEGIFFTSKAADTLAINSSGKTLIFDNLIGDIFVKNGKSFTGTRVIFNINTGSTTQLDKIFRQYTDESFEFSKTSVTVSLYKMDSEYISRSQARRVLSGLGGFKTVTLDFKGVDTIGQGFADEVFRIWKKHHPGTALISKNANENVEFMVKRAS
ncbi:MAG: DUF4325 domain-containing protein [Candidatus Omnitrophica bacterium]|nr:DUF4325 domain-containing protein [Candidatus Omnitrophota bacterium]